MCERGREREREREIRLLVSNNIIVYNINQVPGREIEREMDRKIDR